MSAGCLSGCAFGSATVGVLGRTWPREDLNCATSVHKNTKSGVLAGLPHRSLTFLTPLWTLRVCAFIGHGGQTDEVLWSMKPGCLVWRRQHNLPRRSPSPGQLQACKKANTGGELYGKGMKEEVPVMNSEISSLACIRFLLRQLWPMIEGDAPSSEFKRRPGVSLDSSSL